MNANVAENVVGYKYYIQKHKDINITINSSTNPNGLIIKDDNGNYFSNTRNGLQHIKSCTIFTPIEPMLFYNDREYEVVSGAFDSYNYPITIPKTGYLMYKYGYSVLTANDDDLNSYKFTINLLTKKPYKIWLNNKLVSDYIETFDGITLSGADRYLLEENKSNNLKIIAFDRTQGNDELILTYNGVDEIDIDAIKACDLSQFDEALRIKMFNNFSTSQNKTLYSYKSNFGITSRDVMEDVNNTLTIQIFDRTLDEDLRSFVGNNRFRIVGISTMYDKIVSYTNCKISTGVNTVTQMEPNIKNYVIDYEERIERTIDETGYGDNENGYGGDFYGGYYEYNDLRGDGSGSDRT